VWTWVCITLLVAGRLLRWPQANFAAFRASLVILQADERQALPWVWGGKTRSIKGSRYRGMCSYARQLPGRGKRPSCSESHSFVRNQVMAIFIGWFCYAAAVQHNRGNCTAFQERIIDFGLISWRRRLPLEMLPAACAAGRFQKVLREPVAE